MGKQDKLLSTKDFAALTGQSVAAVTKGLRGGTLKGVKKSGKWMIDRDQAGASKKPVARKSAAKAPAPRKKTPAAPASPKSAKKPDAGSGKAFTVDEFSKMTYLTPFGVRDWIKKGILSARQTGEGDWQVDAANLDTDQIKRLLR